MPVQVPWLNAAAKLGKSFPRNTKGAQDQDDDRTWTYLAVRPRTLRQRSPTKAQLPSSAYTPHDQSDASEVNVSQFIVGSTSHDEPRRGSAAPGGLGKAHRDGAAQRLHPSPCLLHGKVTAATVVSGARSRDESRGAWLRLPGRTEGRQYLGVEALKASPRMGHVNMGVRQKVVSSARGPV
ncbi:hypothetical protein CSUB01_09699 [Colletotrichum sublineola]|uniref:Uncharacterized protein n=1 Tax=Colletotrichum sublineola TaxID=1173701 RepID=A0A066XVZ7_COLSU|nr:hypothetical protein CSUB01_09699 [Colletotrichum sublineola]